MWNTRVPGPRNHHILSKYVFSIYIIDGYTKQVDWWSFGAVLFEMLTGAPPYYSSNRNEILKKVVSIPVKVPDYLSDDASSLLTGLLTIDVEIQLKYSLHAV
jgi:serine/threonine protein kinase